MCKGHVVMMMMMRLKTKMGEMKPAFDNDADRCLGR